jgi:hypothetical protein
MASNSSARWRARFDARNPQAAPDADLPEWLRNQWTQGYSGGDGGDGSAAWSAPGNAIMDSQGRSVVLLNDDGSLTHNDFQWNEGAEGQRRFDPELGWVTDRQNLNQDKFEARRRRNAMIAAAIVGGGALAGAAGLAGAGAAGGAGEAAGGIALSGGGSLGAGAGASGTATFTGLEALGAGAAGGAASGGGGASGIEILGGGEAGIGAEAAGSATGGPGGIGSQAMNWLRNNPMQAARLGIGAAGMFGGGSPQAGPPAGPVGGPAGQPVPQSSPVQQGSGDIRSAMSDAVRNNIVSAMMRRGYSPTGGW